MTRPHDDTDALERAAAELAARLSSDQETPLPAALAARIAAEGRAMVEAQAPSDDAVVGRIQPAAPATTTAPRTSWLGWAAAAAAIVAWFVLPSPFRSTAPRMLTPAELQTALLADSVGTLVLDWAATADSAARGAKGAVTWNGDRQQGVMRIRGLAPNDPRLAQYQLWIFDATRNERYPVDGGVFDVTAGEVLVPITARLPVREPVMFAVTVEPPGGVVVSSRERIVLVAQVRG